MKFLLPAALLINCIAVCQTLPIAAIKKHCDNMHAFRNFNGNVLVAQHGVVLFQKSYGYADFEFKKPLTQESVFNICSISKEFTAAAIMLCQSRGWLSIDDSLRKFFPQLPFATVTVKQMLQHRSGIPSTEFLFKEWAEKREMQMRDLIPLLTAKQPDLLAPPGIEFHYSNLSYMLLALIIERVSGIEYGAFLQKNIFQPLKMYSTGVKKRGTAAKTETSDYIFDYVSDSAKSKSYFHPENRADWKRAQLISGLYGNGNIFSTTGDLLRWQNALNSNQILTKAEFWEMIHQNVPAGIAGMLYYGYGFSVNPVPGDTMIFHNGGTAGYSTTLRYLKNADLTIISLANTNRNNDPTEGILALLADEKLDSPSKPEQKKLSYSQLKSFVGTYEAGGRQFEIQLKQDTLFRVVDGADPLRLIPSSSRRLHYSDESDRELIFDDPSSKEIRLLKADGLSVKLKKVK